MQPEYQQQPQQAQQPQSAPPSYGPPPQQSYAPPPPQPHYAAPPPQPHYMQVEQSPVARSATSGKGQRQLIFGVIWLVAGISITAITYNADLGVGIVAWGPVLWGIIQIVRGIINISKSN